MKLKTLYKTIAVLGLFAAVCCGMAMWRVMNGTMSDSGRHFVRNSYALPDQFSIMADVGQSVIDNLLPTLGTVLAVALLISIMNRDFSKNSDQEYVNKFR
jgi:hypothetical protein